MRQRVIGLVLITLTAAACSSGGDDATTTTAEPPADEIAVSAADFAFTPNALTVRVGDTVTFSNDDAALPHTSTAADGSWNSETLQPGDSFSVTLDDAGVFDYTCSIHPSMTGSITVEG